MVSEAISSIVSLQHEVLIHAPVILFLLCPLLILLGAALPPLRGRPFRLAALVALALGTLTLFFATPAPEHVDPALARNPAVSAVEWLYRSLVLEARVIFIGLTAIYIGVILLPEVLRRRDNRLFSTVLPLSFLVLYSAGAVFLVQTSDSAAAITWQPAVHATSAGAPEGEAGPH